MLDYALIQQKTDTDLQNKFVIRKAFYEEADQLALITSIFIEKTSFPDRYDPERIKNEVRNPTYIQACMKIPDSYVYTVEIPPHKTDIPIIGSNKQQLGGFFHLVDHKKEKQLILSACYTIYDDYPLEQAVLGFTIRQGQQANVACISFDYGYQFDPHREIFLKNKNLFNPKLFRNIGHKGKLTLFPYNFEAGFEHVTGNTSKSSKSLKQLSFNFQNP